MPGFTWPGGVRPSDFAFTVTDDKERVWDVYHIKVRDKPATIAFRLDEKQNVWVIGVLDADNLPAEEVLSRLRTV